MRKITILGVIAALCVMGGIVFLATSLTLVSTGQVKELRLFGRPYNVLTEGAYLTNPFADTCPLSIATEVITEPGENLRTADAQIVTVPIAVNYRFKGDSEAVFRFFDLFDTEKTAVEKYLQPNVRSILAETCREYTVEELQNRGSTSDLDTQIVLQAKEASKKQDAEILRLKEDVRKLLSNEDVEVTVTTNTPNEGEAKEAFSVNDKLDLRSNLLNALKTFFDGDGIVEIVNVSITDVDFSDDYDKAIEEKSTIIAAIQAQKFQFSEAVETARKEINEARGISNATLRQAENTAEATRERGKNEAAAIIATAKAKAEGYTALSEHLTPEIIKSKALEKWNGNVPKRILVGEAQNFILELPSKTPNTVNVN